MAVQSWRWEALSECFLVYEEAKHALGSCLLAKSVDWCASRFSETRLKINEQEFLTCKKGTFHC